MPELLKHALHQLWPLRILFETICDRLPPLPPPVLLTTAVQLQPALYRAAISHHLLVHLNFRLLPAHTFLPTPTRFLLLSSFNLRCTNRGVREGALKLIKCGSCQVAAYCEFDYEE